LPAIFLRLIRNVIRVSFHQDDLNKEVCGEAFLVTSGHARLQLLGDQGDMDARDFDRIDDNKELMPRSKFHRTGRHGLTVLSWFLLFPSWPHQLDFRRFQGRFARPLATVKADSSRHFLISGTQRKVLMARIFRLDEPCYKGFECFSDPTLLCSRLSLAALAMHKTTLS
jgi:hypothetical protein